MLGLASTVSSGSPVESLYSLTFDGVDDYLDTGATFNTTFAGDFSISMWVKPDDGHAAQWLFASQNGSKIDTIEANIASDGKIVFVLKALNGTQAKVTTDAAAFTSGAQTSWTHLGFIANIDGTGSTKTTLHVYVNGSQVDVTKNVDDLTAAIHLQWETDKNLPIGAVNNQGTVSTNPYNNGGKITDFAIWNAKLDDANFLAIYNSGRPTNLTLNSGNYIKAASLQAYYRMGNGSFDDKANGVIHDQNTANRVYNGDFEVTSGATGATTAILDWAESPDSDPDDWAVSGGVASIGARDAASTLFQNCYTLNKTYKTKLDVVRTAGTLTVKTGTSGDSLTITSSGTYETTGIEADANASLKIIAAADFVGSVDSIVVREVGSGHGFGAELVDNGNFSQSLEASDWAVEGTTGGPWAISGGKATASGTGDTKYIQQDVGVLNDKVYKFSYEVVECSLAASGSQPILFLLSSASAFGSVTLETSVGQHVKYVTSKSDGADDDPDLKIAISSVVDSGTISIDNVSLKQVNGIPGLTSGGPTFSSDTP